MIATASPAADGRADCAAPEAGERLLEVENVRTELRVRGGTLRPVDGVSFHVAKGETFGIVGESGCGKSMTAYSVLNLLPRFARIVEGSVRFSGTDLLKLSETEMRRIRGNRISMIFQEPMSSLNPVRTIGSQLAEALVLHKGMSRAQALEHAVELLDMVRIPEARSRIGDYPHHMSGGMRQRVVIAMAIACNPGIILADEPTTALDVTIQAQIMELMAEPQERLGTALILITHDLSLVAEHADRIMVMQGRGGAGR